MTLSVDERWLVALDIDGTIMHEDETLSPIVVEAIQATRDAGHEVTLATGRSWEHVLPVLHALEIEPEYVVAANGAIIMKRDPDRDEGYRRELVHTFDPMPVLRRIRESLPDGRFMVEDADGRRAYTAGMAEWNLNGASLVDFDGLGESEVTRVVCVSPEHTIDEFFKIVEAAGLHQVSYSIGWTAWLDIAPEGVNKGSALERVREWMGFPLARVFTAGDGRNDIEMFEWSGQSGRAVAMGQSPEDVIAVATEITQSVQDDGLASALRTLPGVGH